MKVLLDTHVLIWWVNGEGLTRRQARAIESREPSEPLLVSNITLWEIATLHELGRLELDLAIRDWLERATAPPLVRRVGISPAIAAEVAVLPDDFRRDPADRIIVATGRVLGATLLTADDQIIRSELLPTVA